MFVKRSFPQNIRKYKYRYTVYIHTYILTYLPIYVLIYLPTYLLICVHTYIRAYVHTSMHAYIYGCALCHMALILPKDKGLEL